MTYNCYFPILTGLEEESMFGCSPKCQKVNPILVVQVTYFV